MKFKTLCVLLLLCGLGPVRAAGDQRFIVRSTRSLGVLQEVCNPPLLPPVCTVVGGLGDPQGQLFLITSPLAVCQPATVNQSTAAVLDQSTVAVLDGNVQYAAFGHGTMVMGVIHLVAPKAYLLPLKTFKSDGTGFLSDIVRAIYYGVQSNANVINMSFDTKTSSVELSKALDYANQQGVICASSAGNDGQAEMVYPAGLQNDVMGVAST